MVGHDTIVYAYIFINLYNNFKLNHRFVGSRLKYKHAIHNMRLSFKKLNDKFMFTFTFRCCVELCVYYIYVITT